MKVIKHHGGFEITIKLDHIEAAKLWGLVREGRRAIYDKDKTYNSDFAMDIMSVLHMRALPCIIHEHLKKFM